MLHNFKNLTLGSAAAVAMTVAAIAAAHAAAGSWSLVDSNQALQTNVYGISVTASGYLPPLPLDKLTSRVDQLVVINSGSMTFSTLAVVDADVSNSGVVPGTAPSGTIIGPTAINSTTGPSYTTITNSNGYSAIGYKATLGASSVGSFYVKQFNGPK